MSNKELEDILSKHVSMSIRSDMMHIVALDLSLDRLLEWHTKQCKEKCEECRKHGYRYSE